MTVSVSGPVGPNSSLTETAHDAISTGLHGDDSWLSAKNDYILMTPPPERQKAVAAKLL